MITPPSIPALTTPVVNVSLQGLNKRTLPIISPSQWSSYPTALSTSDLVPGGSAQEQTFALYQMVEQASRLADVEAYGALPFGPPPGFAARYITESVTTNVINGEVRLYCRQTPLIQLTNYGFTVGGGQMVPIDNLSTIGPSLTRRTIRIPLAGSSFPVLSSTNSGRVFPQVYEGSSVTSYWTYLGGYVHTSLAESATAGSSTITVTPTTTSGEVAGLFQNVNLTISDYVNGPENIQVVSANGNVLTLASPLQYSHPLPTAPDFIPVTQIDERVQEAVIYFTSVAVLNRGDLPLTLNTLQPPSTVNGDNGQTSQLYAYACEKLSPWKQRFG